MVYFFLIPLFLCWGSFLNVVAYRLIADIPFFTARSRCPLCNTQLPWYTTIPLISWIWLRGMCHVCTQKISLLYPFIESLTVILFLCLLLCVSSQWWPAYMIFFSALIITIRTDLEFMLISRFASIFLIPVAFSAAYFNFLPLSIIESVCAALVGYSSFYLCNILFTYITQKNGIGEGDMELMAFIGAVIGIVGWWITILIGSLLGSIIGVCYILYTQKNSSVRLPFGPFLALGAIIYVLFASYFHTWLLMS